MTRLALAALLAAALAGCKRKAPAVVPPAEAGLSPADAGGPWIAPIAVLDNVEIQLTGAAEGALVSRELGRQLARCLIEHGDDVVALDDQADPARRARHAKLQLEVAAEPSADGTQIGVGLGAQLVWLDDDALPVPSASLVGEASIIGGRVDTAVLAVTEQLRAEVCRVLVARLDVLTTSDVAAGLADPDPDAVVWTLSVIAARRPAGVVDAVVGLLDRGPPISNAAITALVALHDPRAVTALTDRIELSDRDQVTTVIEACVAIGGPDAEDFLRVITAHADPEVAQHATEGLRRLRSVP